MVRNHNKRRKSNGYKLKKWKFRIDIRKKLFIKVDETLDLVSQGGCGLRARLDNNLGGVEDVPHLSGVTIKGGTR